MKIAKLTLKKFKRFDDLTINLGDNPARIVALVGPNGCGKSSVFDSFEEKQKDYKHAGRESAEFYSKSIFTDGATAQPYARHQAIQIVLADGTQNFTNKSFHIRSAYRFTSKLSVESITAMPDILADPSRPISSIALDSRLVENYQRMLGIAYGEFEKKGGQTGDQVRAALMDKINAVLKSVLDVQISSMGNVMERKGQLYFEKENARDFPYQNLSAGEKEVVDIVLDLIVRAPEFNDTVYCIDEPELHLNTSIQRKLLIEIEKLIPENCQLWMATHSIGFLRALQDELADKCAVLDFSERDYFKGTHEIVPMKSTRANWQKIFGTALDDLVGLIAPKRIVYCEGKAEPDPVGEEQGLDAFVYNEIFGKDYPMTLFISSGGTHDVKKNGSLAIKVLQKAFLEVDLLLLHDRDTCTDEARLEWLNGAPHHRMLVRREIENYLFDFDVLSAFCASKGDSLSRANYDAIVTDITFQDLKVGQTVSQLKTLCAEGQKTNSEFKRMLATHVKGTLTHRELRTIIFPELLTT